MPSGKQYKLDFIMNAQQNSGFKSAFSRAQAEFARLGSEIQSLNRIQGDISAYQKQELAIQRTTQRLENLGKQQENLQRRIAEAKKAGQSTSGLEGEQLKLEESVRKANISLGDQQGRLNATSARLKEAGVDTKDLGAKSQELSKKIKDLSVQQDRAAASVQSYKDRAVESFQAAGEALAAAGLVAGMKQLGEAYMGTVQAAGAFAATMSNVEALSGAGASEIAALRAQAKQLGADTQFTANLSGEAMGYMGMAGWNAQQMLAGMPGVLDLAAASGEDLAGVADIVTDSLTGFGLTAADTSGFVDVLAAASSKSNTNVSMLGESFKYTAPLAGTLGYTAEDTAVMLGLMANSGIKASQAGTTLRTALTNLASPTKEQAAEMERLGLSLTDSSGQMLPLLTLAESLRDRFSDMSQAEQSAAANALFGKEAMSGMLAIINASEANFNSLTDSIYNSAGAAQHMADIKLDNLQGDITLLQSAWDGLGITIGEQFMPQWRGLAQAGTSVLSWVNELIGAHPIAAKAILGAAGAVGVLTTGLVAFNAAKKAAAAVNLAAMFAGPVGPVLALVGGVAAVTAGLVGWFEAANEGRPKVEELTEAARGLDQAMRDAAGGYEASQTELAATAGLADHYLDRLEALDSVTRKTQEQQEQYHATLSLLAETVPELAGSIDLTTDSIEGGTAALRRQTEAWKENAKAQAYQDALKEIYAAQAEAELEREKNLVLVRNAEADLRDMEAERNELLRQRQEMEADPSLYNGEKYQQMEQRLRELNDEYFDADVNLGKFQEALAESDRLLEDAEQKTKEYDGALKSLTRSGDEAADGLLDLETALAGASAAFERDKVWDFVQLGGQLGVVAGDLSRAYSEAYGEAYESISGQMGLFESMSVEVETSVDDMIGALESQATYMSEYSANLQKAAQLGVSEGLLAQLSDGSVESAAYLQEIVNGGQEKIQELNDAFEEVQEGKEAFSQNVAQMRTDFDKNLDNMARDAADAVSEMDLYHEAYAAGLSTMQGYLNAVNGMGGQIAAAAGNVGWGVVSAMNGALAAVKNLRLPGYASGTQNAAPGAALVGERGPEIMFFRGGETVLNATQTAAFRRSVLPATPVLSALPARGSGAGVTITVAPVYQFSGGTAPAQVETVLQRNNAALRELVLDAIRQAGIDDERSVFA